MSPRNDVAAAAMNGVELVTSWLTPAVLFCVLNVMIGTIFFRSSLKPAQQGRDDRPQAPRLDRVSSFLERVKAYNLSSYQSPAAAREEEDLHPAAESKLVAVAAAVANTFHLSKNYKSPHQEPEAREQADSHHVPDAVAVAVANTFHLSRNYRSPHPEPAAREQAEPHHVPDAVAEEFDLDSYESPPQETEAAAREDEEPHHHVERTKSDAVVKAAPAARGLKKSASERISMEKEKEEEDEERWRPATVRERTVGEDEEVDEKADDFINKFRQQLKLQRMDSILRSDEMLNRGAGRWR